jgi:hypothetical protein
VVFRRRRRSRGWAWVEQMLFRRKNDIRMIIRDWLSRSHGKHVTADRGSDLVHVTSTEGRHLYSVNAFAKLSRNAQTHFGRGRH